MIHIGSAAINTNVLLAPMAGCTDLAFRLVARECGASFAFFEMIDSNSVKYGPARKTASILKTNDDDRPIAGQVLGDDPDAMLVAARRIIELASPVFIDINAACPVKKAIKKRSGAYLIKHPDVLYKILDKLVPNLPVPVTVKIRTGFEMTNTEGIADIARSLESRGAAAIFVHGRTRAQGYSGDIDYASIKAIKDSVKIPVFGSGNIFSPELAKAMLDATGCDGVMAARGALGNPWLLKNIESYLATGCVEPEPDIDSRIDVIKRHIEYLELFRNPRAAGRIGFMRKVVMWHTKYFRRAARLREKISLVKSYEKMIKLVDSLKLEREARVGQENKDHIDNSFNCDDINIAL